MCLHGSKFFIFTDKGVEPDPDGLSFVVRTLLRTITGSCRVQVVPIQKAAHYEWPPSVYAC